MQLNRIKGLTVGLMFAVSAASSLAEEPAATVFLSNADGERLYIGELDSSATEAGHDFQFELATEEFGNYFLSMRPFRCLENGVSMLCYLPYPYDKPTQFSDAEMRPLEYDFLFIHRSAKDYGIDPWNGLYYKLQWVDGKLQGLAHAVDLNVLASPPENGEIFPLGDVDLHSLNPAKLWLPTLEIEGIKP